MVFVCELMAPVDPFLKGFFPTNKQPTTRDVSNNSGVVVSALGRVRALCMVPVAETGPEGLPFLGDGSTTYSRSIGHCQLGDSLYKDIYLITDYVYIIHVQ